jgi:hypothetical protein
VWSHCSRTRFVRQQIQVDCAFHFLGTLRSRYVRSPATVHSKFFGERDDAAWKNFVDCRCSDCVRNCRLCPRSHSSRQRSGTERRSVCRLSKSPTGSGLDERPDCRGSGAFRNPRVYVCMVVRGSHLFCCEARHTYRTGLTNGARKDRERYQHSRATVLFPLACLQASRVVA